MASIQLVNSDMHATMRMRAPDAAAPLVRIVLSEFPAAAVACPILLSKRADTGAFYIGALQGFKPGEKLTNALDDQPAFHPLEAVREGFFAVEENIALDLAHDRFATGDGGDLLFDGDGNPTRSLQAVQSALGRLVAGQGVTDMFIAKLLSYGLVEPIDVTLNFDDGERLCLEGLFTVSLDALGDIDDVAAIDLFRAGHLQSAYMMIMSLQHIPLMAQRRNHRLAALL
ncbi:SapC family protein [Sphingobium yanoikuyae]|uniref:SapC-like protein n=1 Tax=Sphingobium yanoikuyae TaxID=13690 RepID=A0A291N857_SPHYA|nr:SapC family protein [Sphingobium yanoikuyae]ATI83300.1 SapC-like protein [Sphingobium yanoikuyae]